MGLQDKLNAMKEASRSKLPVETQQVMKRGLETLTASGRREQALNVGDAIPGFVLQDGAGKVFSSRDLIARTPLVINFYRGFW